MLNFSQELDETTPLVWVTPELKAKYTAEFAHTYSDLVYERATNTQARPRDATLVRGGEDAEKQWSCCTTLLYNAIVRSFR